LCLERKEGWGIINVEDERMKKNVILGITLTLLIMSMLALAFNIQPVKASGTIYIRGDGSIDPDTAPISTTDYVTYTFTDNIYESIVVERDNIVVDGAGYMLQYGVAWSRGIDLSHRGNVTIKSIIIKDSFYGIYLERSLGNSIVGNSIANNSGHGIRLEYSSNNSISENNITNNSHGIWLSESSNHNSISGNSITVNYGGNGISLYSSSNYNSISGNNITNSFYDGITLSESSNNSIVGNNITNSSYDGITLGQSSNNSIVGNNITNSDNYGIDLSGGSSNNSIAENSITNNRYGIYLGIPIRPSNNRFWHNNFIGNTRQVYDAAWYFPGHSPSINVWDDGYPSGGNYWSDYTGVDANGDGIGDTPYIIDENNRDRYPLMSARGVTVSPPPTPPGVQVGVKAGDWIKYDYTITGAPSGTPLPQWLKVEFLSVEGTSATVRVTMRMSDGTEQNATGPVDVVAGGQALGLSGFVIPANLTTGDSVYITGYGNITITDETTRTYAGATRTVVYASFSQYGTQLTYYWDKQTGVMVEASTTSGGMTGTAKATETNMWQAAPSGLPIEPIYLYILAALVIIIAVGAAAFLVRRKKKPTEATTPKEG
jgi:parallel beta-helix repeat protein